MTMPEPAELGRVAVLYGGTSPEREVSLMSGAAVYEGLRAAGVDATLVDIGSEPLAQLIATDMDLAFVALHGVGGEDGTIQALLAAQGIPHTGSGVASSALAMDKHRTKQMWKALGFPTADFRLLHSGSNWSAMLSALGGKVVVKPAREGSSLGIAIAENENELRAAFELANRHDAVVIAERWLAGREFTVAVLDGEALPIVETRTEQKFYTYDAKYFSDSTQYLVPAPLPESDYALMQTLAVEAFESLGCGGWGRVDLMQDAEGSPCLLEVNTSPGMTSHSLVPMAAKAAGISFSELVVKISQLAVRDFL